MAYTNKEMRDRREFENLFSNPKSARAQWQKNVYTAYCRPVTGPTLIYNDKGMLTEESQVESIVYSNLVSRMKAEGVSRYPTEAEFMEACQQYYSRHNATAYAARRDSMGAKPVDETKQQITMTNPLENLTNEELLAMQQALEELHAKDSLPEGGESTDVPIDSTQFEYKPDEGSGDNSNEVEVAEIDDRVGSQV